MGSKKAKNNKDGALSSPPETGLRGGSGAASKTPSQELAEVASPVAGSRPEDHHADELPAHRLLPADEWTEEDDEWIEAAQPPDEASKPVWTSDLSKRPDSLKVRVIASGSAKSGPDLARKKGVEMGFRIGGRSSAPIGVEEPYDENEEVLRLGKSDHDDEELPAQLRPTQEVEAFVPRTGSRRAPRKRLTIRQWTILMAAGTTLLVVAIGGLALRSRNRVGAAKLPSEREYVVEKTKLDESEGSYFVRNLIPLTAEADAGLRRYAAATTAEEALREIRDPERLRSRFLAKWQRWPNPPFEKGSSFEPMLLEGEGPTALGLGGNRGDFSKFFILFTMSEGHLKLDWEASYGVGEVDIETMPERESTDPTLIRAVVKQEGYYTSEFPESEYAAYQLFDNTGEKSIWGYVLRDSPQATRLAGMMNADSFVLERSKEVSATLRVGRRKSERSNQFLILDVLHKGWVSP
jgi:hypothetical protein